MFVVKKGQGTFAGTLDDHLKHRGGGITFPGPPVTQTHVCTEDVLEKFSDLFFQITSAEVNADTSKIAGSGGAARIKMSCLISHAPTRPSWRKVL
jgi:hypothetical protein